LSGAIPKRPPELFVQKSKIKEGINLSFFEEINIFSKGFKQNSNEIKPQKFP